MRKGTLVAGRRESAPSIEESESRGDASATRWAAFAVVALVVCVFWKVVFAGVPISDFYLVAHWDSLFAAYRRGVDVPIDPSGLLESIPYYTICAQQFHAGMLPLWNHLNAFGIPLVGDLQATVFSPSRWLFDIFPCAYTYNLQLVTQVLVCALGTFALARTLGAGRLASIMAAAAFSLSPFMLWYLELQSGVAFVLYPAVFWLFARAGRMRTSGAAVLAGVSSGVSLLIGHPEPAFFGTAVASLLMALLAVPEAGVKAFLRLLSLAAIAALCTAAPVVLPFLEFMRNSDCYKFGVAQSVSVPWQALAFNLMSPAAGGASQFLGVMAVPLMALAFAGKHVKTALSMALVLIVCLIPATDLFPFSLISHHPPISYLITVYLVPLCLLSIVTLAAIGLTHLGDAIDSGRARLCVIVLAIACLATIATPILLHAIKLNMAMMNFDIQLPDSKFSIHAWTRDAVIAGALFFATLIAWPLRGKPSVKAAVVMAAFAALNLVSVGTTAKASLPACPEFVLPALPVTDFLKNSGERCVAMSAHILKPNINVLYGIEDVRSMNVMWPKRYLKFVTACGATPDPYTQTYTGNLSSLLDLGSVKYVLSQTPIQCNEDPQPAAVPFDRLSLPAELIPGLDIVSGSVWSDQKNGAAGGILSLSWLSPAATISAGGGLFPTAVMLQDHGGSQSYMCRSPLRVVFVLKSAKADVLWFSDRLPLTSARQFSLPLPVSPVTRTEPYLLYLRLFDVEKNSFASLSGNRDELLLTSITDGAVSFHPHFVLKQEFDNKVRLFENTGSLPHAYVCFQSSIAACADDSFKQITDPSFDGHRMVVLEQTSSVKSNEPVDRKIEAAQVLKRLPAETTIAYRTNRTGWLVLTDTFYPGWNAYLDGKRVPIVRANYLFRAIVAPVGEHRVVFRYEPLSFWVGLLLALTFAIAVLISVRFASTKKSELPIK